MPALIFETRVNPSTDLRQLLAQALREPRPIPAPPTHNATVGAEDQDIRSKLRNHRSWWTRSRCPRRNRGDAPCLGGLEVEVVGRLVEEQQRRAAQLQQQNLEARLLTSRQRLDLCSADLASS